MSMNHPQRKRNRLAEYDYDTANAYFITVCTDDRKNLFWEHIETVIGGPENVPLTSLGKVAKQCIVDIPKYYPAVSLDHYVIMPNHIHLLLQIHTDSNGRSMTAPTISTVVRLMKGTVTKQVGFPVWQKGFYDHIVRGEMDYRKYGGILTGIQADGQRINSFGDEKGYL